MARGPNERSGPQVTQPGSRLNVDAPTTGHHVTAAMLTDADGKTQGEARGYRMPAASASLYQPAGRRAWWWISLRCPHCGGVHLHRVREEDQAPGPRRAGCGKKVWVVIRSVYRMRSDDGAAG
jgi:hypothetical protein